MSKAFTKEDDDTGFSKPPSAASLVVPTGPFRLTATGAKLLDDATHEGMREAIGRAQVQAPVAAPTHVRDEDGGEHAYRLVTAEERGLVGEGCSLQSPIGRALLGARVGEVREVVTPRGTHELEVVALDGETPSSGSSGTDTGTGTE
jgi:Transcription elongation factor, GreA/GreB, C-term